MYITSRLIAGFVLGFEVLPIQALDENENVVEYLIYKLDLGFLSINMVPTKNVE